MQYEIPEHPWFRVNKFPNHSIQNVEIRKIKWFLDAFNQILGEPSPAYKEAISELATMISRHYTDVQRQYSQCSVSVEGAHIRFFEQTPLERAINTAWIMNCEFWPSGMMNPGDLKNLEYFSFTR